MVREGFHVGFPPGADAEVAAIRADRAQGANGPGASGQGASGSEATAAGVLSGIEDMRGLPWSAIDNDTSKDIDQIEVADRVQGGIRVRVGIADVSGSVKKDSVIDRFAADQTQTVYTAVRNFPDAAVCVVDRPDVA